MALVRTPTIDNHAFGREFENYLSEGKVKTYRGPTKGDIPVSLFLYITYKI
jgi:hypothetical protein